MVSVNLKLIIHLFLDFKEEDDVKRPQMISEWVGNYKNGRWGIGE